MRSPSHDRRVAGASASEFVLKGPFRPGWYSLRFRGRSLGDGPRGLVRLTAADGQDRFDPPGAMFYAPLPRQGEPERVELTIHLPTVAASIRVSLPQDGEARLWGLKLRRKSRVARIGRLLWAGAGRLARSPRRFLRDLERYLSRPGASGRPSSELSQAAERLPCVNPLNMQAVAGMPPRLNVVLPGLVMWAMSGGPNTIINLTYRLARLGVPVRYISADVPMEADPNRLWEHFRHVTGIGERLENVELVSAHDRSRATPIGEDDVFFGTAWWTVQEMRGAMRQTRHPRFLYMIQDFEPGLYPWSTAYALAMETYGMDFRGIICGRLLAEHLCREQVGRFADGRFIESCAVFEPAVDRGNFYPDFSARVSRPKRLVFYARPGAPRNLYELGLAALKRAAERGLFPPDQWEVLLMGEPQPSVDLGHGVVARAHPWCDYRAYGRLLRESDVGLSLMLSPHSSYPPLEIAACGALAVTNVFGVKTAARLREISGNLIPVEPTVEAVTEGLIAAVAQVPDLERRRSQSRLSVPESWEAAFAPILPKVLDMWNDGLKSRWDR